MAKWDKYRETKPLERLANIRKERKRYLIVCEGKKTEPNYFEAIKQHLPRGIVDVEIHGIGANTQTVVEYAQRKKKEKLKTSRPYDKVWVVFDRDSFSPADFDNAIHSAGASRFGCAWSNEAFELWYLLHFEYRNTSMSRREYKNSLSKHMGEKYRKNDPQMYRKLIKKQEKAVKYAEKLLQTHKGIPPSGSNPATTVYLLVNELNEYL
ncbi:MAG: RloB family protein [Victivallaceae bacterium]|nr:RloB family protein [Victivallaceae bacterium]